MKIKHLTERLLPLALLMLTGGAMSVFGAARAEHAIVGRLEQIDRAAKTVAVKTADEFVHTVRFTGKTIVRGLGDGARAVDFAGREGGYVIVHYSEKGAVKTARAFEYLGRETPRAVVGTVDFVGRGARRIAVTTADGAEEAFDLADHALVETGAGLADAARFTARETDRGAKFTVHYTEASGRRVARFFEQL